MQRGFIELIPRFVVGNPGFEPGHTTFQGSYSDSLRSPQVSRDDRN